MDEDLLAFLFILFVLISLPFTFAAGLTACIAYSRTKAWDKQRRLASSSPCSLSSKEESARLVNDKIPTTDDEDSEFYYDTEDEQEQRKQKAEDEADRFLTFGQKFRKEVRGVWCGNGGGRAEVARAQKEERRKLAKAVVREMEWRERRRERSGGKRFGGEVV